MRSYFYIVFLILEFLPIVLTTKHGIPIWPDSVPGSIKHDKNSALGVRDEYGEISDVHVPSLSYYPSVTKSSIKSAVIVCPGGGYSRLAFEKEGVHVARWLSKIGIDVFILIYRHRPYKHPSPLQDGLQAIRYVRFHAQKYDIDPDKIGIMGFSAGGHLAASTGTLYTNPAGSPGSPYDSVSPKPDFMALIYPVISMDPKYTHMGSRNNLVGDSPSPDVVKLLSLNFQVTETTPPTFLIHTGADEKVSVQNSVLLYSSLQKDGISTELHIFSEGPHGLGVQLNQSYLVTLEWPRLFEQWMIDMKYMQPP